MQTLNETLPASTSLGSAETCSFKISLEDQAHILHMLRSQIYSDKIMAVIREYSCNARDAHASVGLKKPISVTLPTHLEPLFVVRDFGPGLSQDEMFSLFTSYGASTKRDSNAYVGQLGIGSKSAFAYSDQFTVISYNGGTKKTYACYIDEDKKGSITLVSTEDSDETGLEICVPVSESDFHIFRQKTEKFFRSWVEDEIPSGFISSLPKKKEDFTLVKAGEKGEVLGVWFEDGAGFYYDASGSRFPSIIMGGVRYELNSDMRSVIDTIEKETGIDMDYVNMIVPIGSVTITPSREHIEGSRASIEYIKSLVSRAAERIARDIVGVGLERDIMRLREVSENPWLWMNREFVSKFLVNRLGSNNGISNSIRFASCYVRSSRTVRVNVLGGAAHFGEALRLSFRENSSVFRMPQKATHQDITRAVIRLKRQSGSTVTVLLDGYSGEFFSNVPELPIHAESKRRVHTPVHCVIYDTKNGGGIKTAKALSTLLRFPADANGKRFISCKSSGPSLAVSLVNKGRYSFIYTITDTDNLDVEKMTMPAHALFEGDAMAMRCFAFQKASCTPFSHINIYDWLRRLSLVNAPSSGKLLALLGIEKKYLVYLDSDASRFGVESATIEKSEGYQEIKKQTDIMTEVIKSNLFFSFALEYLAAMNDKMHETLITEVLKAFDKAQNKE